MTGARLVMIVDDDRDLREALGDFLAFEGYRTVLCENGVAALRRLNQDRERPDLILLDLMMPQMNGWEFRKRQLEEPSVASVPVVVMTASRNVENITPNAVVFKPPDLDRLLTVIKEQTTPGAGAEE